MLISELLWLIPKGYVLYAIQTSLNCWYLTGILIYMTFVSIAISIKLQVDTENMKSLFEMIKKLISIETIHKNIIEKFKSL